jgi:hypothetical protein
MGLKMEISSNFLDVAQAFSSELSTREIVSAAKRAINKSLVTMRKESLGMITEKVKVKPSELRKRFIELERAGSHGSELEGALAFSKEPLHLLRFVKGSKDPIEQKGIPVKRRRKLRVEIAPGQRILLKHAFIQTANSPQVFKRGAGGKLKRQSAPSIGFMVEERSLGERIAAMGQDRLVDVLLQEMEFQVLKAQGKVGAK